MAAAGGSSKRMWVVDVEKKLKEADKSAEVSRWERHCIYQVPPCMTNIKSKAYQPQVVSLGPFHHGDRDLRPMEELEGAYMDLDSEWRAGDGGGRDRFLAMMIFDGCFLLEVMRCTAADGKQVGDYAHNDPIFSPHGILYMVPYIRRDVLMLENQLPLLLLQKLVQVESGKPPNDDFINRMVLKFLAQSSGTLLAGIGLGLHPLSGVRIRAIQLCRRFSGWWRAAQGARPWANPWEHEIAPAAFASKSPILPQELRGHNFQASFASFPSGSLASNSASHHSLAATH